MYRVPQKLREKWRTEDWQGIQRTCMRIDDLENCRGRMTKEHAIIYASRQLQEEWAILDICAYHHSVDEFQDGPGLDKERNLWIALNRAPEERLINLSKGVDQVVLRNRLNEKYGIYKNI